MFKEMLKQNGSGRIYDWNKADHLYSNMPLNGYSFIIENYTVYQFNILQSKNI